MAFSAGRAPTFLAALEVALAKVEALDTSVKPIDWAAPGTAAGMAQLRRFLDTKLKLYGSRNDPNVVCGG